MNARLEQLRPLLSHVLGTGVEIRYQLDDCLSAVRIDPAQLERIVVNLAVNARDAMPGGGLFTIQTDEVAIGTPAEAERMGLPAPGRYVRLSIADTGIGMSEEVSRRIFEPFFTTKERDRGTGLGLSTVMSAVREAAGAVTVQSTPGAGSRFAVLLPRAGQALSGTQRTPIIRAAPARSATVLVAEDLAPLRSLLCRILEQGGHRVLAARDGEEALAVAAAEPGAIDLLVTDIAMPRLTGAALADRLIAARPGLPILFVSGQAADGPDVEAAVADRPGREFLAKPFTVEDLIEAVRRSLDATRA
jgi:two-component system, cell cycle sensor histidine kinase and response regulator CckA